MKAKNHFDVVASLIATSLPAMWCAADLSAATGGSLPGPMVIQPRGSQDGYVLVASGAVNRTSTVCLWGKDTGQAVVPVGIHSLPEDLTPKVLSKATLSIPEVDAPWTNDTSCAKLALSVEHIAAANEAEVTATDATSAPLARIGDYRTPGAYRRDYQRSAEFDVTALVRADLAAGRKTFAWRITPQTIPDAANSQGYFPTVENEDLAFPNRGARLHLWFEAGTEPVAGGQSVQTFEAVLTSGGRAQCTLVIADEASFLEHRAVEELARVIKRDSEATVPTRRWSELGPEPSGTFVVVGTPESVPLLGELADTLYDGVGDLPLIGPDGYAIQTLLRGQAKYVLVAGATPRGTYYGAMHAREQVLESQKDGGITVKGTKLTRVPALAVRSPYTLGFTGAPVEYTLDDWKAILDGFARESVNQVYFWWQSQYKPKNFPDRRNLDGGLDRLRMTDAHVNELADYAHKLGMKFLLGGGAFAWGGASALTDVYPETRAEGYGMCPNSTKAWELHNQFMLEMLDAVPRADGIWFEIRDEHGECKCDVCQTVIDEFGSEQYGQGEIGWLKQFAKHLWTKRPDAEIAWLVELSKGSGMHSEDPAYFRRIAEIKDPRIQWVVVWGNWEFPGPEGIYRPITFFSRQNIWWDKPYATTLEAIRASTLRAADSGLLGYSPAWEVWFGPWYYAHEKPFPMDRLPYELTAYAFREFCWDPGQTMDAFKKKMGRRYFGPDAPMQLVDDLIYLRELTRPFGMYAETLLMLAGERANWDGSGNGRFPKIEVGLTIEGKQHNTGQMADSMNPDSKKRALEQLQAKLQTLHKFRSEELPRLTDLASRLDELESTANGRARSSFALMRRCINDIKEYNDKIGMTDAQLALAIEAVNTEIGMPLNQSLMIRKGPITVDVPWPAILSRLRVSHAELQGHLTYYFFEGFNGTAVKGFPMSGRIEKVADDAFELSGASNAAEWTLRIQAVEDGLDLTLTAKNLSDTAWPGAVSISPCISPRWPNRIQPFANRPVTYTRKVGEESVTTTPLRDKANRDRTYILQQDGQLGRIEHMGICFRSEEIHRTFESGEGWISNTKWNTTYPPDLRHPEAGLLIRRDPETGWVFTCAWDDWTHLKTHDAFDCLHVAPRLGPLDPDQSKTIRGRIRLFRGTLEEALARTAFKTGNDEGVAHRDSGG